MIPFNKIHLTGKEKEYVAESISSKNIAGNGVFTQKCQAFFEEKYNVKKTFLTSSCTDALELASILIGLQPNDEVIMPSFTFVSTANAFLLRGAKIIFADSEEDNPNIDADKIEALITTKTKAIVVVHYAGIACDMDKIMAFSKKYNLFVIEDAAHSIDSYYKDKPLGTIGHLGAFSFHESKNISSGEGGLLMVNDSKLIRQAEVIWEKGTDRAAFLRGEINKYGWKSVGSSFYPADYVAAFLYAQLESLDTIQQRRKDSWNQYFHLLKPLAEKDLFKLPSIPEYSSQNGHIFHLVCNSNMERIALINYLKERNITASFHFSSLHGSSFFNKKHDNRVLENSDKFSNCLVRLPLFYDLTEIEISQVTNAIITFFQKRIV